jgi:hypothetical protein
MKKHLSPSLICSLLLGIALLGVGCESTTTEKPPKEEAVTAPASMPPQLGKVLEDLREPEQRKVVSGTKPSVVKGKAGTRIEVNPADLQTVSGKPVTAEIEVELVELMNAGSMVGWNSQTVSDGKLLSSGGSFFIGMKSGGEELELREGKSLTVVFPQPSRKGMELFAGQRNEDGTMNWTALGQPLKEERTVDRSANPSREMVDSTRRKGSNDVDDVMAFIGSHQLSPEEDSIFKAGKKAEDENWKKRQRLEKSLKPVTVGFLGWYNLDKFWDEQLQTVPLISFKGGSTPGGKVTGWWLIPDEYVLICQDDFDPGSGGSVSLPVGRNCFYLLTCVDEDEAIWLSTGQCKPGGLADKMSIELKWSKVSEAELSERLKVFIGTAGV